MNKLEIESKLDELIELVETLTKRVDNIDRNFQEHIDRSSKPYQPVPMPYIPIDNPRTVTGCSVCGIQFNGPAGYVCSNMKCPTRVTCY